MTPPRLAARIAAWLAPADVRASFLDDLQEAFDADAAANGHRHASRWYRAQVLRSVVPMITLRLRLRRTIARDQSPVGQQGGSMSLSLSDLRFALHGLRARGWRSPLILVLMALALAANAIVFSAADSFVFHRVPFRDASSLVEISEVYRFQPPGRRTASVWPELVDVWRKQTDLFSAFHADTLGPTVYLAGGNDPRYVATEDVTPGLFEMLGAAPIAGRLFNEGDARTGAAPVAILGEEVAAKEFARASAALGQHIVINKVDTTIVGVMPISFRYPSGRERIWRPLDLTAIEPRRLIGPIARMAPGMTLPALNKAVAERAPTFAHYLRAENSQNRSTAKTEARPIFPSIGDPRLKRLFILLFAAAGCLLLVACANVANLELGAAIGRSRTFAISLALGASRRRLVQTVLFEGALLIAVATAAAFFLAKLVTGLITDTLPAGTLTPLPNRIDVDARTIWFMAGVAAVTWLLTSIPVAMLASRASVLDALKLETRSQSTSRGGVRVRHLLTTAEIALTVLLLTGAAFTVQAYTRILDLPKGFDSSGLVTVSVIQKSQPQQTDADLQTRLLAALRGRDDVLGASIAQAAPPTMGGYSNGDLSIGSDSAPKGLVSIADLPVTEDYFRTMRLPILAGRPIGPTDDPNLVVVDEMFARRFWPNGDAIGQSYHFGRISPDGKNVKTIIGVAAHVRTDRDTVSSTSESFFPAYYHYIPSGRYTPLAFAVRLKNPASAESLLGMVRSLAPGARVRVVSIDDLYAATFANEMLASNIMTAFGALAFVVAAAGVYGVMMFLVASRTREIGVRMALGADRAAVARMVLRSSLAPVLIGAALGVAGAVAASRWAQSMLFGLASTGVETYSLIVAAVVAIAVLATWQPARQAIRVDPSALLRE